MKRAVVLIAALITVGLPAGARAQGQGTSVGLKVGVNLADLAFDAAADAPDRKSLTGLVAGLFATVPINGFVGFQPEALFSMQGTQFSQDGITVKLKIDYLQVPLLGRFAFGPGSPAALVLGPSLGVRTRARISAPGAPPEASEEFEDQIERFDLGLVTGVTADVGRLVLDGRYTWGLRNIAKDGESDSVKNKVWSFTAGVRF